MALIRVIEVVAVLSFGVVIENGFFFAVGQERRCSLQSPGTWEGRGTGGSVLLPGGCARRAAASAREEPLEAGSGLRVCVYVVSLAARAVACGCECLWRRGSLCRTGCGV